MKKTIRASAPGSLMLLGEHAVLHGRRGLVSALSPRLRITMEARLDARVMIASELGHYAADLLGIRVEPPFTFLLAALRAHVEKLEGGLNIKVDSDFRPDVGLGSSAAITVAAHAALSAWCGEADDREALLEAAVRTLHEVQGRGSGADLAAAIWGGTVAYRAEPREVRALAGLCPLTVLYSGTKRPTAEVVALVEEARRREPALFDALYDAMDLAAGEAVEAVEAEDWPRLGHLFNAGQGLMEAIGVSNAKLAAMVHYLRARKGIFGAKISGSGLGDCVVGLGRLAVRRSRYEWLDAVASSEGVTLD